MLNAILHVFAFDIFEIPGGSEAHYHVYLPELETLFCMYVFDLFHLHQKDKSLFSHPLPANHKQVKIYFVYVVTFNLDGFCLLNSFLSFS